MTYNNYLKSSHWKNVKKNFTGRKRCKICKKRFKLNLHHKHYKTIKFERKRDLVYLCNICHKKLHKKGLENFINRKSSILRKLLKIKIYK